MRRPIAACAMVKDEADVVGRVVRHTAAHVDRVLVADNGSTDGTREILADLVDELDNLEVVDDPEVGYYQSRKMSALAARVADGVSCWVVPFDADEVWLGLDRLRTLDLGLAVWVPGFDYIPARRDLEEDPDPLASMTRRRASGETFRPKVIPTAHPQLVITQGNHAAELHGHRLPTIEVPGIQIAHFPVRSYPQLHRKARNGGRAYAATDLPPGWGAHWRTWGDMTAEELAGEYHRIRAAGLKALLVDAPVLDLMEADR